MSRDPSPDRLQSAPSRPRGRRIPRTLPLLGWREWVSLPELGLAPIRAKVDTGARTSSLQASLVDRIQGDGVERIRFRVREPGGGSRLCSADLLDERVVRSSNGQEELRPVILTAMEIAGTAWPVELTLSRRAGMGFPLLVGREAIRNRFQVDPGRSFLTGRPDPRDS